MIYLDGFYDELTVFQVYESHVRQNDYVVDVGANVGVHSLAMSRLVAKRDRCTPTNQCRHGQANAQKPPVQCVHNIRIRQTALGDFDGRIPFK